MSLEGGTGNPAAETSQAWTLLQPNTDHSFRVRACNVLGCSSYSGAVTGKTLAVSRVPETPTGVSVGGATNSALTVSWTPSSNPDGMAPPDRFEVSLAGGTPNPGPALSQTWTGLASGTTFSFQVRACNSLGCSPYSAAATGKTTGTPPAVDRAPNAMAAPFVGSPTVSSLVISFAAPSDPGLPSTIVRYEGQANGGAVVNIGNPPSFTWNGLTANTTYSIVVRACNGTPATTCGPWSVTGSGKTSEQARVPGQMSAPVIQDSSQTAIRIGFAAPGDPGVPASIVRYEGLLHTGATADISTSGTFVWGGLAPGTTYTFQVRACNVTGCGPWSAGTSGSTLSPPPTPTVSASGRFGSCPFGSNCLIVGFSIANFAAHPGTYTCVFSDGFRASFDVSGAEVVTACYTNDRPDSITIEVNGVRSNTVST